MELLVLIVLLFFLLALRVPIAFALLMSSFAMVIYMGLPPHIVITQVYSNINSFTLLAIPFFLMLGRVLNEGEMTDRLVAFADALVGHIRGGLGHINVVVSMVFASLSGSASADTASVGAIIIPTMKKAGYNPAFVAAITAASSTLGNIIPPSIIMVIYGAFGQVSVGALFLGGVVPGILIGLSQMIYVYIIAVRHGHGGNPRSSLRVIALSLWRTAPVLLIPILVLGGIISGMFTPTEAASIATAYALVLAIFYYRVIKLRQLPTLLARSVHDFAVPLFAIACAGIFGWLISFLGAGEIVSEAILRVTDQYYGIFGSLILFLLLIGTFLSPMTAVIIFMPVIQSLGELAGVDPVHLGVSVVMALACGLLTPPYGICVLIAAQIGEVRASRAFAAVLPLIAITVGIIFISMVFPDIILFLPKLFMPKVFIS